MGPGTVSFLVQGRRPGQTAPHCQRANFARTCFRSLPVATEFVFFAVWPSLFDTAVDATVGIAVDTVVGTARFGVLRFNVFRTTSFCRPANIETGASHFQALFKK